MRQPFKTIGRYRSIIGEFKCLINNIIAKTESNVVLYFGSDKNVYVQIMARCLKEQKHLDCLIAVDQGNSNYEKPDHWRLFKQIGYWTFSRLFLGITYDYIDVIGSWRSVQKVWVRWPDLLQFRRPNVEYLKIELAKSSLLVKHKPTVPQVLILSAPLAEDRILPEHEEMTVFYRLIKDILSQGFHVAVKPHPRDNEKKFSDLHDNLDFTLLERETLAEELNYWDYDLIVNFGSSTIMDMLDVGFPPDRILTIDLIKISNRVPIYKKTKICYGMDEVLQIMRKDNWITKDAD
ncbi:MAG: polysialyltransferase family glycosyltransferase [Bacillota bacterium]